jgi:hypothetical protein
MQVAHIAFERAKMLKRSLSIEWLVGLPRDHWEQDRGHARWIVIFNHTNQNAAKRAIFQLLKTSFITDFEKLPLKSLDAYSQSGQF